jgi:hypothetical protein
MPEQSLFVVGFLTQSLLLSAAAVAQQIIKMAHL